MRVFAGVRSVDATMTMSKVEAKNPAVTGHHILFQDVRWWMLGASIVQFLISLFILTFGSSQYGNCETNQFGDWGMVYGGLLCGCSIVTSAAVYGRLRLVVQLSIILSSIVCVIALGIDGVSYFCFDFNSGANRNRTNCRSHIEKFNSCTWKVDWKTGSEHYDYFVGDSMRMAVLVLLVFNFVFGVGIMTTAQTEAGKLDLCQFEEALRELKETNEALSYRKRAKRNRILTQFVSKAKPYEGSNYCVKLIQFFGFGTDVEVVPVQDRKIKIILPPEPPPKEQDEAAK